MKILCITNSYPHADNPSSGVFVKSEMDSLTLNGIRSDIYYNNSNKSK